MDAVDLHPVDFFRIGSSNDMHLEHWAFLALDIDVSSTRIVQRNLTGCILEDGKEATGWSTVAFNSPSR